MKIYTIILIFCITTATAMKRAHRRMQILENHMQQVQEVHAACIRPSNIAGQAIQSQSMELSSAWACEQRLQKVARYENDCNRLARTENAKIPTKSDNIVRIATYNVHFWKKYLKNESNFDEVMCVLQDINADVIILEEMYLTTSEFLSQEAMMQRLKKLGYVYGYDSFGRHFTVPGMTNMMGELILSKIPLTACSVASGVKGKYHGFSRIELVIGDKKIAIYGTHTHVSNTDQRVREIQNLLAAVQTDTADYIILGADWNAVRREDYSDDTWQKLEHMYRSALRLSPVPTKELQLIADAGFVDSFTAAGFQKPHWTVWNGTMVDFLFVKAKSKIMPITGSYVYYTPASDHIPVIMDLMVQQPQARL